MVPVWQGDTLHQIRAGAHVFATGTIQQPLVFAGNDLPGVMLAGGARRLAALYAVAPGEPRGARDDVATAGSRPPRRCAPPASRSSPSPTCGAAERPAERCAVASRCSQGHTVVAARGEQAVSSGVLAPVAGGGGERRFACDLVLISGGHAPAASLPLQAGARAGTTRRAATSS